jgi:hypothetical protein
MAQNINKSSSRFSFCVPLLPSLSLAGMIVGEDLVNTVKKGDTLDIVEAFTGINRWKIATDNNIDTKNGFRSASS